ncbi:unnamed protein product [Clonostachys solani]|uniref:phospholipase A2 n=1 Tax=Clonostachys solani TaxID=160281 RepID=A0A9N9ZJ82_9HYPO|nr:unnamed protein product [Clonostachys solani]
MAAEAAKPRVLCLDGGGIRGLSEILILKELMLQVRIHNGLDYTPEPYQCFDFICGTSTGGLLAVLLGRLGKTLDECEELFRKLGSDIFESSSLLKSSRLVLKGSKHTGESLGEAIRAQAGHGLMYDEEYPSTGHVPVAVVAVSKTTINDYLFRTYGVRANTEACPIVDACRATSAATTFFPSIMINGVEYVDGAFGKNNPSGAALSELESSEWIAPMQDAVNGVACFVSVGTGRPTIKLKKSSLASSFVPGAIKTIEAAKSCMKIATDCHKVHLEVANRFTKAGANEIYYRFDVDRGLESVALDESDKEALQHISAVTKAYLRERSTEIEKCARLIVPMRRDEGVQGLQVTVCSGLPEKSPYFYGRGEELGQVRDGLEPSKPGRKAVLLCGIGGSGKTQLVLQHIEQYKTDYTAIIWINVSNKETAAQSLEEASIMIATQWPADLPMHSNGSSNTLSYIRSRLLNTRHRNWLLVLDSLDDPNHHFADYIPSCNFGSVIVTSTAFRSCSGFRPEKPIEVEGLDTISSLSLLNTTSKQTSSSEEGKWSDGKITPPVSHPQEDGASPSYKEHTASDEEDVESAAEDDESTVKLFLNKPSFNVDSMAPTVKMALYQAANNQKLRPIDIILQSNMFGVSERDVGWLTPLYWVYARTYAGSPSKLLDAILNYQQDGYTDPVPLPDISLKYQTFIHILLERHSNPRFFLTEEFFTEQRHQAAVKILLQNSPDTKLMGQLGVLPLVFAAEAAHEGVVKLLLDHKADIEAKDEYGYSPLVIAARYGHEAIVKLLLDNKADIEAKEEHGHSALSCAASYGYEVVTKLLLDHGANTEVKDTDDRSPLLFAAAYGYEAVTKLLLDNGANIEVKDKDGYSPLLFAASYGNEAVTKLLLDNGANTEVRDKHGRSPLLFAVINCYEAVVKLLLNNKADIEAEDNDGRSPLALALDTGQDAIVKLLLESKEKYSPSRSLLTLLQGEQEWL